MLEFFQAGGFNMFILAAFGVVMIPTAIQFARNADAQRLSLIRALTTALVFATLVGFFAGLASTAKFVADPDKVAAVEPLEPFAIVLLGFAESTTNLILGGGIAVITWILVAVGVRRMPSDPS